MRLLQFCTMLFLLGESCDFVIGVDDFTVQFEGQKACFKENTDISIVLVYTGAGTPIILRWKFSKMTNQANTLNIDASACTASAGADPAFPVSRMNYTCDNMLRKYTTTIKGFSEASDAGTWEVAVLVSSFTNFQNVTVEKCAAPTPEPDCCFCMIGCPQLHIVLCIILCILIILVVVLVVVIIAGMVVEAIFVILGNMSKTMRIVSFCAFLFGLGLFLTDKIRQRLARRGNNDTSKNAVGTGSNPKNAEIKLLEKKKPSKSPGKTDDVNKEKPASVKQNQHADQAHKVENEGKKPGRDLPPPPVGANHSSQLPNIHTPGHDNKGRGLSANFGDDDHPLVAIDIPAQKAGALPTIVDTPRETKKKTKKKKKDKQEDNQKTETVLNF